MLNLLPVTQGEMNIRSEIWNTLGHDRNLGKALATYGMGRFNETVDGILARHRISHSLPGDVGMREALEAWRGTHFFVDYDEEGEPHFYTEAEAIDRAGLEGGDVRAAVQATFRALTPSALSGEEQARKIAREVCERRNLKRDNGLVYGAALEAAKEALGLSALSGDAGAAGPWMKVGTFEPEPDALYLVQGVLRTSVKRGSEIDADNIAAALISALPSHQGAGEP